VRVYADTLTALPRGTSPPTVQLRAFRNGRELGTGQAGSAPVLPEFSPAALTPGGPAAVPLPARLDARGAYTFTLPWRWADGRTTFTAEINPVGLEPSLAECRTCRADDRFTLADVPFRVTTLMPVLPLALRDHGKLPKGYPDPAPRFAGMLATSPLHVDVQPYRAVLDVSDIVNDPGLSVSERSAEARELVEDWAEENDDNSAHYPVGIFPRGTIGGSTNSDGELYSDDQPQSVVGDNRELTETAHELGHGIGRKHAGQDCDQTRVGDPQEGEKWSPPDERGMLDGVGLDMRVPPPYRMVGSGAPGHPGPVFDLMSYCAGVDDAAAWTSVRNWDRAVLFRAPPQPQVRALRAAGPVGTLEVVAFAFGGHAHVSRVGPTERAATPLAPDAPFTLVARDADGHELARAGVQADRLRDATGVLRLEGRVTAPGAASVAFEQAGATGPVASRVRSAHPPRAVLRAGRKILLGHGTAVSVSWTASDADHDRLRSWLDFSADGGHTWRTVAGGLAARVVLPRRLFPATVAGRLRVRVSDGFEVATATSGPLRSSGTPPTVAIRAPQAHLRVAAGAPVVLDGSAWDDAGRPVSGTGLRWRDGRRLLGTGAQVTAVGLAPGRRTITLEAVDTRGRSARRGVSVLVTAVRPLFSVLGVPAFVRSTARTLALRVATTVPATLTAAGRRTPVGPVPRRVVVPVRPGRAALRLELTLRSGTKVTKVVRIVHRR
jgi:hypothetical protein